VSFHVEVKRGFHSARMFNLDERELRHRVLEPWSRGMQFEFGGREWDPAETSVRVLEGRALDPPELAHGQGWNAAEKVARDVTRELLSTFAAEEANASPAVGVVGEAGPARDAVISALEELGLSAVAWNRDQQPEGVAALVVVVPADGHLSPGDAEALRVLAERLRTAG
jgi:hypothetical protein